MQYPKRKVLRLKEYDYSTQGAYFVTICTRNHKCILSAITVGAGVLDSPQDARNTVGAGVLDSPQNPQIPQNKLTQYGIIADKYINQMNNFYNYISVDKYVIMPNHIHLLLSITENRNGSSGTPTPTNSIIAKFVSTFKRFCNKEYGANLWQRGYNDHIIRGKYDYDQIWKYIDENIAKWEFDKYKM